MKTRGTVRETTKKHTLSWTGVRARTWEMVNELTWTTFFFGIFDFLLLAMTLADTVSDILVGFEFRSMSEKDARWTKFYYAVVICFVLGSISDCVGWIISMEKRWRLDTAKEWVFYVACLLPFSQLLPLVTYLQSMYDPEWKDWTESDRVNWEETTTTDASAEQEEAFASDALKLQAAVAAKTSTVAAVDRAVQARQAAFLTLNISAVVESLPMCVIQLAATSTMSGDEEISSTMVISLAMSLMNVTIKTVQLCRSFEVATIFAKFSLMAFDIMSTAFVCASLFSPIASDSAASNWSFIGLTSPVRVSNLSWWWLTLKAIDVVGVFSIMLFAAVRTVHDESKRNGMDSGFRLALIFSALFVLAPVPVAILQEAVKLSWYVAMNLSSMPRPASAAKMPLLHHFLHHSNSNDEQQQMVRDSTDWVATFDALRSLLGEYYDRAAALAKNAAASSSVHFSNGYSPQFFKILPAPDALFRRCQRPLEGSLWRHDNFATRARHVMLHSAFITAVKASERASGHLQFKTKKIFLAEYASHFSASCYDNTELWKLAGAHKFTALDLIATFALPPKLRWYPGKDATAAVARTTRDHGVEVALLAAVMILTFITAVFGLMYAPLHFFFYYLGGHVTYSSVQLLCLIPCLLALASSLCLLPTIFRYEMTCSLQRFGIKERWQHIAGAVDSYYTLPLLTLCSSARGGIGSDVIPQEACERHILPFLDQKMVGLYGVAPTSELHRGKDA